MGVFGEELAGDLVRAFPDANVTAVRTVPPRAASRMPFPEWVPSWLVAALRRRGVESLYEHQRLVADQVWAGVDSIVTSGTSSGKSLSYLLPVLVALAEDPGACALYISPTKALAQDQVSVVSELVAECPELAGVLPAVYDGDTPVEGRRVIREKSRFVVTNPDMLHAGVLRGASGWSRFLGRVRVVVVDECHAYRGVFGAHVSLVLRRVLRLCGVFGSSPVVVCASATSVDPVEHAARLTGRVVEAVTVDGAPRGARTFVLWQPGFLEEGRGQVDDEVGDVPEGTPVRRAASSEAARIMARLVGEGARVLGFVKSRQGAEYVASRCQEELASVGRVDLSARVAAYRAGYTPEERRAVERALDVGDLVAVASTSALELGIDVGGLDCVVTAGFPGSVASLWQQAGRAGRRGQGSLVVLVARDEPMDAFLVHHPEHLLDRPVEAFVFDPRNPHVLRGHVLCAAVEAPLDAGVVDRWGAGEVVDSLVAEGLLRRRRGLVFPASSVGGEVIDHGRWYGDVDVRGGVGSTVSIVESDSGRVVGTVDAGRAPAQVHPGAVYVHQGRSFVVEDADFDAGVALVVRANPPVSTHARSETDICVLGEPGGEWVRQLGRGVWLALVDVEVTSRVSGYVVKDLSGRVIDHVPLDVAPQSLVTRAVAVTLDPLVLEAAGVGASGVPGSLHAAEHALIGLLPLLATCDRLDIGGVSTALHPDTGLPSIFIYDGFPGGAGFAEQGFRRFGQWVSWTLLRVRECGCEAGCPSCIQSPKCGNGNNPLDKAGAVAVLSVLDVLCRVGG